MKVLLLMPLLLLCACADLGYYLHSARGQVEIMRQTRSIDEVLADSSSTARLREQLRKVRQIRRFAFDELALPVSGSYGDYADLGRSYVLKNLFAADEFSIRLQRWCYPLVGCAGYRGFFDENRLARFRDDLRQQGKDVYVAHVSAYSTLGWFDDPVLNTFVYWPDERLAGLIFHELAHQRLYIDGDTRFNESFATAVQQAGVERWLAQHADKPRLHRYRQYLRNRASVIDLIEHTRQRLAALY
ncbi:MAG: aminopeptidase, partial [Mariprofundaceae bacterium]|nr:aminopeptidase [Mariprofundaceae bacterium]